MIQAKSCTVTSNLIALNSNQHIQEDITKKAKTEHQESKAKNKRKHSKKPADVSSQESSTDSAGTSDRNYKDIDTRRNPPHATSTPKTHISEKDHRKGRSDRKESHRVDRSESHSKHSNRDRTKD